MREEIWTEKIFKDDVGYFLRITWQGVTAAADDCQPQKPAFLIIITRCRIWSRSGPLRKNRSTTHEAGCSDKSATDGRTLPVFPSSELRGTRIDGNVSLPDAHSFDSYLLAVHNDPSFDCSCPVVSVCYTMLGKKGRRFPSIPKRGILWPVPQVCFVFSIHRVDEQMLGIVLETFDLILRSATHKYAMLPCLDFECP